jgi:hypothetical protein
MSRNIIFLWQEIFLKLEVIAEFNAFMDILLYYFDIVYPLNICNQRELQRKIWITQRTEMSNKNMHWLNSLQKKNTLMREQTYISRYQMIYKSNKGSVGCRYLPRQPRTIRSRPAKLFRAGRVLRSG